MDNALKDFEKTLGPEVMKVEWLLDALHEFGFTPAVCVAVVLLMKLDGILQMSDDGWISLVERSTEAIN